MRSISAAVVLFVIASTAAAQSSLAACGDVPDATARQTVVSAGDLKVCLLAMRSDPADTAPRQWATRSHVVILETQQSNDFRRLVLETRAMAWTVNGKPAPYDSTVESWQKAVIDVLDAGWAARRLTAMSGELRATDIALPSNADSVRAMIEANDKQIALVRSKIAVARADLERLQRGPVDQRPVGSMPGPREVATRRATTQVQQLYAQMEILTARQDLFQLQLERLDPSNPNTRARQSAAAEVSSRRAVVEDELYIALTRLRAILSR
jgi:hypothetical protein